MEISKRISLKIGILDFFLKLKLRKLNLKIIWKKLKFWKLNLRIGILKIKFGILEN